MKKRTLLALSAVNLAIIAACGLETEKPKTTAKQAWDGSNTPWRLSSDFVYTLGDLPTEGRLSNVPWASDYWPNYAGSIAYRWARERNTERYYVIPSASNFLQLNDALGTYSNQVNTLSPAEKFDIFNGNYSYPITEAARSVSSPTAPKWWGICHGWSAASVTFSEPAAVDVTSKDGVPITFASGDVKGLLSSFMAKYVVIEQNKPYNESKLKVLGTKCEVALGANPYVTSGIKSCDDTNPGAFHIVISNMIGRWKKGFMMDMVRDVEVWNHPIYSFSTHMTNLSGISATAAQGTTREVLVDAEVLYVVEAFPTWQPMGEKNAQYLKKAIYQYRLELRTNADGKEEIIGGEWLSAARPDFMWTIETPKNFASIASEFASLDAIYKGTVYNNTNTQSDTSTNSGTATESNTATGTDSGTGTESGTNTGSGTATGSTTETATTTTSSTTTTTTSSETTATASATETATTTPTETETSMFDSYEELGSPDAEYPLGLRERDLRGRELLPQSAP